MGDIPAGFSVPDFGIYWMAIEPLIESKAGMDGSRTHHGSQSDPTPVLKTGRPTRT